MNFVVRHPDNYIRVEVSAVGEYSAPASTFVTDYGQAFPETSVTSQWPGVLYEPERGGLFVFNKKTRQFIQEDWAEGQAVIDALASLIMKEDARLNVTLTLSEEKILKIVELKHEALDRIRPRIPITDIDMFSVVKELWLSIALAVRQPTIDFQFGVDIYGVVKSEASTINVMTVVTSVTNYDVVNDPTWPA